MSLTRTLGQFIADLSPNRLPEEAVRVARLGFIDCIGTMIAGRREDCVRIMKEVLAPADGPATLTFGREKSAAPEAAWINGTALYYVMRLNEFRRFPAPLIENGSRVGLT